MNEMRKLMEAVEQINEVSDFDGGSLDKLIAQFEETCEVLGIAGNPVKQKELTQVVIARAEPMFDPINDKEWRNRYGMHDEQPLDEDQDSAMDGYTKRQGFNQFLIDFDQQLDDVLQAAWVEAEDEYGIEGNLDPVSEGKMEDIVSAYCKMRHV